MHLRTLQIAALVLTFAASAAHASPLPLPTFSGYVVDQAQIIEAPNRQIINDLASELDHAGTAQLALCTVSAETLGDTSKEEFSTALFKQWGLGHGKQKADGVLIFMVPGPSGKRRIRVEVGYAMEALLNDGKVGALIDTYAVPRLKTGDYGDAASALARAIAQVIRADAAAGGQSLPGANGMRGGVGIGTDHPPEPPTQWEALWAVLGAMILLFLTLFASYKLEKFVRFKMAAFALLLTGSAVAALLYYPSVIPALIGWISLVIGLLGNAFMYALIAERRCPKCGGWLRFSYEITEKPTYRDFGEGVYIANCKQCGFDRRTPEKLDRVGAPGQGFWSGGSSGTGSGSGGTSSSGSRSGGGGGSSSSGGFSGGGGGDSGGGGAGRDV